MPSKARNHDDDIKIICGCCSRKEKDLRNINQDVLSLIKTYQFDGQFETEQSGSEHQC